MAVIKRVLVFALIAFIAWKVILALPKIFGFVDWLFPDSFNFMCPFVAVTILPLVVIAIIGNIWNRLTK